MDVGRILPRRGLALSWPPLPTPIDRYFYSFGSRGGRSHFIRLGLRSCSQIFESGSGSKSFSGHGLPWLRLCSRSGQNLYQLFIFTSSTVSWVLKLGGAPLGWQTFTRVGEYGSDIFLKSI